MAKIKEREFIQYLKRRMRLHPEFWKSSGLTEDEYIKKSLNHSTTKSSAETAFKYRAPTRNKRVRFIPNDGKDRADLIKMRLREKLKKP